MVTACAQALQVQEYGWQPPCKSKSVVGSHPARCRSNIGNRESIKAGTRQYMSQHSSCQVRQRHISKRWLGEEREGVLTKAGRARDLLQGCHVLSLNLDKRLQIAHRDMRWPSRPAG